MPGFSVHPCLWVCSNSCPLSQWHHPTIWSSIALSLSQQQDFSDELVLPIRWSKYWSFSFSNSSSNKYSGLISFRIDWFDLPAVQGTFKSLLQHHIFFSFYCGGFCHTLTWISHGFTCVLHHDPPSRLPLHPIPLGHPSAPALSTCLMHPTWAGDLFNPWKYTCFNAVLSEHPTLAFPHRV